MKAAGCYEIYIFGSLAKGEQSQFSDIDLAVKGLPKSSYYDIGGRLMLNLKHKFDLIELDDDKNNFSKFIVENEVFVDVA